MFEKIVVVDSTGVEYMGSGAFEGAWKRGCFFILAFRKRMRRL